MQNGLPALHGTKYNQSVLLQQKSIGVTPTWSRV